MILRPLIGEQLILHVNLGILGMMSSANSVITFNFLRFSYIPVFFSESEKLVIFPAFKLSINIFDRKIIPQ